MASVHYWPTCVTAGEHRLQPRNRNLLSGALLADLRYGWRGLRRRRAFTLIAALILALGIGATTAVFSLFYAVLMRPLPYKAPQRLVIVWAGFRSAGNSRAPV
ncbi:MAG: hypothetical protein ACRD22_22270, partial [Terriglobia bacterium]